jgi:hypothetical protein
MGDTIAALKTFFLDCANLLLHQVSVCLLLLLLMVMVVAVMMMKMMMFKVQ